MTKQISYAISQRFQWFFVVLSALAYGGITAPWIQVVAGNRAAVDTVATTTIFIAYTVAPLATAIAAVLLTHRRGLARAWVAAGAGFMEMMLATVLMWVGSIVAPWQYAVANVVALSVAVATVLVVTWIDRRTVNRDGWLRQWRVIGVAAVYFLLVMSSIIDAVRIATTGLVGYQVLQVLVPLGGIAVCLVLTSLVYRRVPIMERAKRLLLLIAVVTMAAAVSGGLMFLLGNAAVIDPQLQTPVGLGLVGVAYVAGVLLLRSSAPQARKVAS